MTDLDRRNHAKEICKNSSPAKNLSDDSPNAARGGIIRDEDDDELEHRPPDPDEDKDLEEDDYGNPPSPNKADHLGEDYFEWRR